MAKSRRTAPVAVLIVLLAAAAGGWYAWHAREDRSPRFYTTKVDRGEIVQTVTASGTIKPLVDVVVSSQISGYITAWYADFNSKVRKGDLLATLRPTAYEAAVKSAEGDLANAKANYDLQSVTLRRDADLLGRNLIAQSDCDTQKALVEEAAAQIQIKQASLDTAKTNLSYCRIVSPMDGIVISRNIDVGNSVAATLSSPTLFEIGNDLTRMQIDAAVAEADVGYIKDGQEVDFTVDAYPNRTFRGVVYQVRNAPQTQQNVVIYDVMIKVANDDLRLKPGMTANASIVITRHGRALRVANSALRFRLPDGMKAVSVADPAPGGRPAAAQAAPARQLGPDERRQALRQIFQEAGFSFGSGPPSPETLQKIRELAAARGIDLPERFGRGRQGTGGDAPVTRVVYRLPAGAGPGAPLEAVRLRIGITDGANTEILGGAIKDGDVLMTGVDLPSSGQSGDSPFGGPRFGRRF